MAVDLAVFSCFVTALPLLPARAAAIWLAMTWNYALNRRFTFAASRDTTLGRYALYCLSCSVGAGVNWGVSVRLCQTSATFHDRPALAAAIGVAAGFAGNYLLCCRVVFRPHMNG